MGFKFNPLAFAGFSIDNSGISMTWVQPVDSEAQLPANAQDGEARIALDTHKLYIWDDTQSQWIDTGITLANFGNTPSNEGVSINQVVDGNINRTTLTLQPADQNHPGGVSTEAQTFSGEKTFAGDVIVQGDLTVEGALTSINSTELDVEDANITVNKGGNDASAQGAGVTVERMGVDGSIIYDSTVATRFKIGDVGSEVEVVDLSTTQTLSNKIYNYDNSTSGLTATDVQAAIDEVEARVEINEGDIVSLDTRMDAQEARDFDLQQSVFVAKNGNDGTADGSIEHPYLTIQGAINAISDASASKKYAILLQPGIYSETLALKPYVSIIGTSREHCSVSSASPITITGAGRYEIENVSFGGGGGFNINSTGFASGTVVEMTYCTVSGDITFSGRGPGSDYFQPRDCFITGNLDLTGLSNTIYDSTVVGNITTSTGGTQLNAFGELSDTTIKNTYTINLTCTSNGADSQFIQLFNSRNDGDLTLNGEVLYETDAQSYPIGTITSNINATIVKRTDAEALAYDNATSGLTADDVQSAIDEINTNQSDYIPLTQKGAANGVAELDANGKVPVAQLPNAIMEYVGTWDASTNTPTLTNGAGNPDESIGNVYRVSVAGTVDFGAGNITFNVGDYAILNSSKIWEKSDTTDAVISVNSQLGVVVLDTDDISEGSTNLYFTDQRAIDAVGPVVVASTGDINETSFSLANNQTPVDVTGFNFPNADVRSFDALVSVFINAATSLYESFRILGIQKGSGDWDISIESVGDTSQIQLSITSAGQMQYSSADYPGFVSGTMKFRALTTSV